MAEWRGLLAVEGLPTVDGRFIEHGALRWDLPIPLLTEGISAELAGTVTAIERRSDGNIWGMGQVEASLESWQGSGGVAIRLTDFTAVDDYDSDGQMRIREGRIQAVFLTEGPAFSNARIEEVETNVS